MHQILKCSETQIVQFLVRGADNKWYPYDKYLERLDGLDRKRERIYGLWVNLTSPNKTCVINRWNDGDAAIALMLRTSSGEKEETIGENRSKEIDCYSTKVTLTMTRTFFCFKIFNC